MFAKRNFVSVFHHSKFLPSKKPPGFRDFHKITLKELKTFNFLYPVHISPSYGKYFHKLPAAEVRKKKESLIKKKMMSKNEAYEATSVQITLINDFISSRTSATDEDWDTLLRNISSASGNLNELNINGKIMERIAQTRNLDLAKDYIRFMKKRGQKFNLAVVIEFLKTCYYCEASLTEEDLKAVRIFTNYLIDKFKIMDVKVGAAVIGGLSTLNDWEKCLEIAENLEKNGVVIVSAIYSTLIICLLKNQQFELARKILRENFIKQIEVQETVYNKWIEIFQNDPNCLEELLNFFKEYSIIPKKSTGDYLIRVYSQLPLEQRLKGKFTTLKSNGQCDCCQRTLEKNILQEDEFNEVRDAFLNRVLVGEDVFKNTTPTELQSFYKMVQTHGPFDVVIDGLNVAYFKGTGKPNYQKASLLERVVDVCFKHDKKIFIIGRKHMKHFTPPIMENILEKSHMFLINDESEDDPFMIYATLYSGPNCNYVTRDYLRSEKFRLSDFRLCNLFKQWQLSHQIMPYSVLQGNLKNPLPVKFNVQRTTPESWHIPCRDDGYNEDDLFERKDSVKWLCLRRE